MTLRQVNGAIVSKPRQRCRCRRWWLPNLTFVWQGQLVVGLRCRIHYSIIAMVCSASQLRTNRWWKTMWTRRKRRYTVSNALSGSFNVSADDPGGLQLKGTQESMHLSYSPPSLQGKPSKDSSRCGRQGREHKRYWSRTTASGLKEPLDCHCMY